jgi:hypothetical protein
LSAASTAAASATAASATAIAAWPAATRTACAWPATARAACAGAIAAWPVHTRTIATRPVDAWTVTRPAWPVDAWPSRSDSRPAPTAPSYRATPAEAAPPVIAAPIPARPVPTVLVPAIASASPIKLNALRADKIIGDRPYSVGVERCAVDHGGVGAPGDHCTDDHECRGQYQVEFAHASSSSRCLKGSLRYLNETGHETGSRGSIVLRETSAAEL